MQGKIVNTPNCITLSNNNRDINKLVISTNNNLNKIELKRFKSNEAYFSPKAKTHRKNKLFLNAQKSNKKIEINLNDHYIKRQSRNKNSSLEKNKKNSKKNIIKFSPSSKKLEINKNPKFKPNYWFKSKNINQIKTPNKPKYMINNMASNKSQNKFDKLFKEESIKELEAEENDDNNNSINNNTSVNKNNRNNITKFNINTVENNTYESEVTDNNNGN